MRAADVLCALVLLAGAGVVIVEGLRLGIGWGTDGPQPGFFIFFLGLALAVCCSVILGRLYRDRTGRPGGKPFLEPGALGKVATVAGPAALMVAVTHVLGLYVAGALYLAGYMRWVGRYRWWPTVLLSLAVPAATFLVFEVWFLVPLPKGPVEAALGY